MQPSHVISFVDFKIAQYESRYNASKSKFDSMLEIYKSASWLKKWVTENPCDSDWEYWWVGSWIDELKEIRREAEYKNKMDYMRMDIPENWQKHFYKWAQDNNIPF
jgi:hypothetical protein